MPTKRPRVARSARAHVTPAVIAAFQAGDYLGLHRLLGLKPWERSPLPRNAEALGVCLDETAPTPDTYSVQKAQDLRRAIEEAINAY